MSSVSELKILLSVIKLYSFLGLLYFLGRSSCVTIGWMYFMLNSINKRIAQYN